MPHQLFHVHQPYLVKQQKLGAILHAAELAQPKALRSTWCHNSFVRFDVN